MNFKDQYLSKCASEIILHHNFVSQCEHSKKDYLGYSYSLVKVLFLLNSYDSKLFKVQN